MLKMALVQFRFKIHLVILFIQHIEKMQKNEYFFIYFEGTEHM